MICSNCGKEIEDKVLICYHCGSRIYADKSNNVIQHHDTDGISKNLFQLLFGLTLLFCSIYIFFPEVIPNFDNKPPITIEYKVDNKPVTLKVKYENNYVHYSIVGKGNFMDYHNTFASTIELFFIDNDGFEICNEVIRFRYVPTDINSFNYTGKIRMTKDNWKKLKDIRLSIYKSII